MKIQSLNKFKLKKGPQNVGFGLHVQNQTRYVSPAIKRVTDTVRFVNGKKLAITKEYHYGDLYTKLFYLKDAAGSWVKSKLQYFSRGKAVKEMRGGKW